MIGRLRGELVYKRPPQLMLDVGGVGYELDAPMSTFYELPAVGATVTLFTHLAVREDAQVLYGFSREQERGLFRSLLKVTGVGPRMALAILSGMEAQRFAQCIEAGDEDALIRVPGIGRKTAQRLIVEMRDRVEGLGVTLAGAAGLGPKAGPAQPGDLADAALKDAISALVALGYKPLDAQRMARAADDGTKTAEEIIRGALRSVSGP